MLLTSSQHEADMGSNYGYYHLFLLLALVIITQILEGFYREDY